MAELTDEQIREENKFLKGLPRFNVGAFFMPAIWGPAHGFWATIVYYPAWLLLDNLIYLAYSEPTALHVVLAVSAVLADIAISVVFAIVSQPIAAHRAEESGISREQYLKRQRIWAVVCVLIAAVFLSLATIYNLNIRTEV